MSTSRRTRRSSDEGFTLVELTVALGLLMVILLASLPAFLGMLRTAASTKVQTQAKNLSQQRLEQLKDLRFHIDRQNGPFLDLLDIYYTNASTTGTPTTVTVDGASQSGVYVPVAAAADGAPAGPHYRVTSTRVLTGRTFTQSVYARFLGAGGAPLAMTNFQNAYDSQVAGKDDAPAGAVAITIVTSWPDGLKTKRLVASTRIVDGRPELPAIQTQARATALQITSTGKDGATLELAAGIANVDGTQSSSSAVSGYAAGARATRTGFPTVTGKSVAFELPTGGIATSSAQAPPSSCSWFTYANTDVSNGSGSVSTGLPKAPANVDDASPPNAMSGFIQANAGGSCGLASFDNLAGGGTPRPTAAAVQNGPVNDPLGYQMGAAPYVKVPDLVGGSGPIMSGSAYATSSVLTASPQKSSAGAAARATQPVVIFPNNPESGGRGLVSLRLLNSSITCTSATTSGGLGTATGSYTFELGWWGKGPGDATAVWHLATWTYNSASPAPVLQAGSATWDPQNTLLGNGLRLSDVITSPGVGIAPSPLSVGATTGLRGFGEGIFSITTASTITDELQPGFSAIKVSVGRLTCVADDQR